MAKFVQVPAHKTGEHYLVNPDQIRYIHQIESQESGCRICFDNDRSVVVQMSARDLWKKIAEVG